MSFVEKSPSLWLFCYSGLKRLRHGSWCSLCIYFWLCWKEIALCRLSLVAVSGVRAWVWYTGFSLQWLLWLWSAVSRHIGFSSCDAQAQQYQLAGSRGWAQGLRSMDLLCSIWSLSRPGLELVSPTVAGEFLSTVLPAKSWFLVLMSQPGQCLVRMG